MPITFFNEKSGQTVTVSKEPHVAAFMNSSDMGINVSQGQDFGWRLDVADKIRIEKMRSDMSLVMKLAQARGIDPEDLRTKHFVDYILEQDMLAEKMRASLTNENPIHAEEYQKRLRAARESELAIDTPSVVKPASKKK